MIRTTLIMFFFVLFLSACDKDSDDTQGQIQTVSLTSYPLTMGNKWEYYTEAKLTPVSSSVPTQIDKWLSTMEVVGDTIINGEVVMKMAIRDSSYDGVVNAGNYYLVNRPTGFYIVAITAWFVSRVDIKSSFLRNDFLFHQGGLQSVLSDSLYLPDSSLTVLKFPMVLGESWHAVGYSAGFYFDRKYEACYLQTTDAGVFNCVRVKGMITSDTSPTGQEDGVDYYMYYSSKGLVRSSTYSIIDLGGVTTAFTIDSKLTSVNF